MSQAIHREIEDGARKPDWETWDAISKMFSWRQTFVEVKPATNSW